MYRLASASGARFAGGCIFAARMGALLQEQGVNALHKFPDQQAEHFRSLWAEIGVNK